MFSFRRPSNVHQPHSSSSHTGSSASGSVISAESGPIAARLDPTLGYDSDYPNRQGWESDAGRASKAVRWNPGSVGSVASRLRKNSTGYATDAPPPSRSTESAPRARTYSSQRKMSGSGSSISGTYQPGVPPVPASYSGDEFQMAVDRLLRISTRTFAITGTVPLLSPISMFFQTPTGSCHLLRFPSESSIPSRTFDAFIAACEPVTSSSTRSSFHTFRVSPNRPINPSFDIASHPILDTVKRSLFPAAADHHYLTASLNRVDVFCPGASSFTPKGVAQPGANVAEEEPVAHVIVTMPVRFRGGMMSISKDGNEERFWGRGTLSASSTTAQASGFSALGVQAEKKIPGSLGNIEWVAYMGRGDCETRIDKVEKGVRINLVYDVYMKSFGPYGAPRPPLTPNDNLLAALSSVLKRSRGMKLAFYLTNDYGISPSHALADSLVPSLKGSDLTLYHALKFYNLAPQLRYTSSGFIWPQNQSAGVNPSPQYLETMKRLAIASAGDDEDLAVQIEDGGGVRLEREGIIIATGREQGRIGREQMAFLEARESKLGNLPVNVCLVVYVH